MIKLPLATLSPLANVSETIGECDYATSITNGEQLVETLKSRLKPTSFWPRLLTPGLAITGVARTAMSSVWKMIVNGPGP